MIQLLLDQYKVSEEYIDNIFPEIVEEFITEENCYPVPLPTATILGAQPGAGKTGLQRIAQEKVKNNTVICNADEFRLFHPKAKEILQKHESAYYQLTNEFAQRVKNKLLPHCLSNNYNFVLESTFSSKQGINDTLLEFKKHKFEVNVMLLAVDKQASRISTLLRYEIEKGGGSSYARIVLKEGHDDRFSGILPTVALWRTQSYMTTLPSTPEFSPFQALLLCEPKVMILLF